MADLGLVYRLEGGAGGGRNSLLVLVAALTGMSVKALQALTWGKLSEALQGIPKGTPHRVRASEVLRQYKTSLEMRRGPVKADDLVFTSHLGDPGRALCRETMWRIVKKALSAVLGPVVDCFRALRVFVRGDKVKVPDFTRGLDLGPARPEDSPKYAERVALAEALCRELGLSTA